MNRLLTTVSGSCGTTRSRLNSVTVPSALYSGSGPVSDRVPRKSTSPAGVIRSASSSRSSNDPEAVTGPRASPSRPARPGYCCARSPSATGSASNCRSNVGARPRANRPDPLTSDGPPSWSSETCPSTSAPSSNDPFARSVPRAVPRSRSAGANWASCSSSTDRSSTSTLPSAYGGTVPSTPSQRISDSAPFPSASNVRYRTSASISIPVSGPSPRRVPITSPCHGCGSGTRRARSPRSSGVARTSTSVNLSVSPITTPNEPASSVPDDARSASRARNSVLPSSRLRSVNRSEPPPSAGSGG